MSPGWNKGLCIAGTVVLLAGCQPKSRIRDDPFLPSPNSGRATRSAEGVSDARREDHSRSNRDFAKGVSTSPATDDNFGRPSGRADAERDFVRESGRADQGLAGAGRSPRTGAASPDDPLANASRTIPEKTNAVGNRSRVRDASYARSDSEKDGRQGQVELAARFEEIRRRLDRIGARNLTLEPTDRDSGEMSFRCEVPFPDSPDRVRVFEARDPDELKLMLAVAKAAEDWVAAQKQR